MTDNFIKISDNGTECIKINGTSSSFESSTPILSDEKDLDSTWKDVESNNDDATEEESDYDDTDDDASIEFIDFLNYQESKTGVNVQINPDQDQVNSTVFMGVNSSSSISSSARLTVYSANEIFDSEHFDHSRPQSITDAVFHSLRSAQIFDHEISSNLVVCWGGHSISYDEYEYTKLVGYELGLLGLDVCTGSGPGAMKGSMKGAKMAHSQQRISSRRYVGLTEPGIIAAEPPNRIVNSLVIMPDIEKRLEAFVRMAHGLVVFPGGGGTTEEIFYLTGILLDPANADKPFPVVLTGPRSSAAYFESIRDFLAGTIGDVALSRLKIVIDDHAEVARIMKCGSDAVRDFREKNGDSTNFNWKLRIDPEFQKPFQVTHAAMRTLRLHRDQPPHELAANLRRAFSGIVSGNIKQSGIREIERHGPFELSGDPDIMAMLDELLASFAEQQRMKLPGAEYEPCYRIVRP